MIMDLQFASSLRSNSLLVDALDNDEHYLLTLNGVSETLLPLCMCQDLLTYYLVTVFAVGAQATAGEVWSKSVL